jgi:hypothetical protein
MDSLARERVTGPWTVEQPAAHHICGSSAAYTLARQAKEAGLLEPDAVERMVREALLARRVEASPSPAAVARTGGSCSTPRKPELDPSRAARLFLRAGQGVSTKWLLANA